MDGTVSGGRSRLCVSVAEHHDGFQMYRSDLSDWNAVDMGPKQDVLGELKEEAKKRGIHFCTSSHRAEHWFFLGNGKTFDSDIHEPLKKGIFTGHPCRRQIRRTCIPDRIRQKSFSMTGWHGRQNLSLITVRACCIFDWWVQHEAFKPYLKKLAAFYYNCGAEWGTNVAICYKHDAMAFGSGIVEMERGGFAEAKPYPWQTDTAIARNSWCYTDTLIYKTSQEIICTLVDVVSKNGNLLLNVGSKADGTLPEGDKKILRDLADWMAVNREAIHGAKVWRKSSEDPTKMQEGQFSDQKEMVYTPQDYRFTVNHGNIYAIALKCPQDGNFCVQSLPESSDQNLPEFHGIIRQVEVLGYEKSPEWKTDAEGLHVKTSGFYSEFPVVLKIVVS